ncbi:MAG TPA: DUF2059 domain-containing protein [Candidatus Angelobacter sp.]|nr:DUF2059 domain-containing protein [Candidatus Angelobacter sp.]
MRKIASLFLAAALTLPAFAQQTAPKTPANQTGSTAPKPVPADAASKEQLMKLFDVLGVNKQIQSVVDSMAKTMQQMMPSTPQMSEKQKEEMSRLQGELFSKMMSPEFIHNYLELMVPIYQQHFTKSDVEQMITFYSSPVGQKFVNEQPLITQETFPKIMPLMQQHLQDVMKETNFDQRMREIFTGEEKPPSKPK